MERRVAAALAADEIQIEIDMWLVDGWMKGAGGATDAACNLRIKK